MTFSITKTFLIQNIASFVDKPHDENLASSCLQWRKPYIPYFTVIFLFSYAHRLGLPRCVLGWPRFRNVKMTFSPFFKRNIARALLRIWFVVLVLVCLTFSQNLHHFMDIDNFVSIYNLKFPNNSKQIAIQGVPA